MKISDIDDCHGQWQLYFRALDERIGDAKVRLEHDRMAREIAVAFHGLCSDSPRIIEAALKAFNEADGGVSRAAMSAAIKAAIDEAIKGV